MEEFYSNSCNFFRTNLSRTILPQINFANKHNFRKEDRWPKKYTQIISVEEVKR